MLVLYLPPPPLLPPFLPPRRVTTGKTKWSCCTAFFPLSSFLSSSSSSLFLTPSVFCRGLSFLNPGFFRPHLLMSLCLYWMLIKGSEQFVFTRGLTQWLNSANMYNYGLLSLLLSVYLVCCYLLLLFNISATITHFSLYPLILLFNLGFLLLLLFFFSPSRLWTDVEKLASMLKKTH